MEMYKLMKEIVDKQIASYQEGHVRNFIDIYIKEIREDKTGGKETGYIYEQMVMMCTDFLFPSLSAMEAQIAFLLKYLLHHETVLKKIQDEIENVVGSGRLPALDDRVK